MSVLKGPRVERRRVIVNTSAYWGTMQDDGLLRLDDGRTVDPATVAHLPPLEPMPSKIIAVHLSYSSRGIE
ncbi:MAG: FAA hydrolase family protein, partial [Novosphingobium sp.]